MDNIPDYFSEQSAYRLDEYSSLTQLQTADVNTLFNISSDTFTSISEARTFINTVIHHLIETLNDLKNNKDILNYNFRFVRSFTEDHNEQYFLQRKQPVRLHISLFLLYPCDNDYIVKKKIFSVFYSYEILKSKALNFTTKDITY